MDNYSVQRYYIRRRSELQNIDKLENTLKDKTISILDRDARESIVVSLSDDFPKDRKMEPVPKEEFLKKHGG